MTNCGDRFDAVEAEDALGLAVVTPRDEIGKAVAFFDPVGGDGAGRGLVGIGGAVAQLQILPRGQRGADGRLGIGVRR